MNDDPTQSSSVMQGSELTVETSLLQIIIAIQEAFGKVCETLAQSLVAKSKGKEPLPDINTPEQLDKAFAAILKPQLQTSLKTLFDAVKPLTNNTYTAASQRSLGHTDVLTARSDTIWLQSIAQKLDVLTSIKSAAPDHTQPPPQPPFHHGHNIPYRPPPRPDPRGPQPIPPRPPYSSNHHPPNLSDEFEIPPPTDAPTNPSHNFKHIDSLDPKFLDTGQQNKLQQFLDAELFVMESGRGTIQYGAKYKYMGSKSNDIKDILPQLQELLDRINPNLKCEVNSILVNTYEGQ